MGSGGEEAQPVFSQALELGITFWDTANVYGYGSSEEIVGRPIKKYIRREDIVLATKKFLGSWSATLDQLGQAETAHPSDHEAPMRRAHRETSINEDDTGQPGRKSGRGF